MSFDQLKLTDAFKPQDGVAVVITLLGVAIAIFLPDSIIKLIGASIAILGALALYITLRQRIEDSLALRKRRTTLPPPAFKTSVTTDSATSTTRIRFDDFQESFSPEEDDARPLPVEAREATAAASFRTSTASPPARDESAQRRPAPVVMRFDDQGDASDQNDLLDVDEYAGGEGEGFRIVTPPSQSTPVVDEALQRSAPEPIRSEPETVSEASRPVAESSGLPAPDPPPVPHSTPAVAPGGDAKAEGAREPTRRTPSVDLEELIYPEIDADGTSSEPRGEFVRLVGQVLRAVGRSIEARSIVFFWINFEKGHLIPEAHVTSGSYQIRTGARIPLGNDIVSQIARGQTAEIITDISFMSEKELICYYLGPSATRSFVGVPVFYRREVVGVLAADSPEESAFSEAAVATLAEYTRLIAGLIRSYTEKYDLHLIARTLDAFEGMSRDFSGAEPTPAQVADALTARVADLFDNRYVATILFDDAQGEWRIVSWRGESGAASLAGTRVDVRGSLVGRATRYADEVLVQGTIGEARFFADERLPDRGTFLAVPLVGTTKCFGALAVEHPVPEAYIPRDVELIRDLTRYAAMAIEVFNTNRAIEAHTMVDETTGLYNAEYLLRSLDREIARARDFHTPVSVALLSIDMPASLRAEGSSEVEEVIAASVGAMVQEAIRPYDTVGRYTEGLLGVVLAARGEQEAYLWGEKLRKEVASRIIAIGQRKSAVTVSIGLCDLGDLAGRDAMLDGARQALERARASDGNAVIVY